MISWTPGICASSPSSNVASRLRFSLVDVGNAAALSMGSGWSGVWMWLLLEGCTKADILDKGRIERAAPNAMRAVGGRLQHGDRPHDRRNLIGGGILAGVAYAQRNGYAVETYGFAPCGF